MLRQPIGRTACKPCLSGLDAGWLILIQASYRSLSRLVVAVSALYFRGVIYALVMSQCTCSRVKCTTKAV